MSLVCLANYIFVSTLCTMLWFCWQINDDDNDDFEGVPKFDAVVWRTP